MSEDNDFAAIWNQVHGILLEHLDGAHGNWAV
jgi:hypothetical protein